LSTSDLIKSKKPLASKTLFLEELQSDWHQAGRKQGYKTSLSQDESAELNSLREKANRTPEEEQKLQRLLAVNGQYEGVPDAPFKKTWPELLLKRMVREAAEKGYDQIAWTDGATQAERYPNALRQKVSAISWTPRGQTQGHRLVSVTPTDGRMITFGMNEKGLMDSGPTEAIGKPVEDIFGKEMGQQILDQPSGHIAGKDFMIGDKGMRGFYDDMLPKIANKAFGKWGGKVRQEKLNAKESPELRSQLDQIEKTEDGWVADGAVFDSKEEAEGYVRSNHAEEGSSKEAGGEKTIHILPITPELRRKALAEGFSLFSSGVPIPEDSSIEPYSRDKVVPGVKLIPVDHQPEF